MDWLLHKYIGLISTRLEKFKRKGPSLYNFRCPLCGDSESRKNIARGYIYQKQGKTLFHCHNCGNPENLSVPDLIRRISPNLYDEYVLEKLKENKTPEQLELESFVQKMKKPKFVSEGVLKGLKKVSQLPYDHPTKQYVVDRKIPNPYHAKLFNCPNYMHFVNTLVPEKFSTKDLSMDETRLLIPFVDTFKNVHAFQGRSLKPDSRVKYITIVLDENVPVVYGLDTVNLSKPVYVFEGPIDSMFINNSIATAGGDLVSSLRGLDKTNMVIVYDNEPRSKDTVKKINKAINSGFKVVIWPDNIEQKDVNNMILAGLTSDYIEYILKKNTFQGLAATLSLQSWSKA